LLVEKHQSRASCIFLLQDIPIHHRKPIELPPTVARSFIADMRVFFAVEDTIKRDEIAGRQMHVLRQYQRPREKPVRIPDVIPADEG
jgi:hypothetical protein